MIFLLTNSLDRLEIDCLIAVKIRTKDFLMYFSANFQLSELKSSLACISETALNSHFFGHCSYCFKISNDCCPKYVTIHLHSFASRPDGP